MTRYVKLTNFILTSMCNARFLYKCRNLIFAFIAYQLLIIFDCLIYAITEHMIESNIYFNEQLFSFAFVITKYEKWHILTEFYVLHL